MLKYINFLHLSGSPLKGQGQSHVFIQCGAHSSSEGAKLLLPPAEFLHVRPDHLLNLADCLDSNSKTVMVFKFHIQPFSVNIRETECPYSLVAAHLSKAHPLTIWISFSLSVSLTHSRYFDRGDPFGLNWLILSVGIGAGKLKREKRARLPPLWSLRQAAWKVHFIKDVRLWWARQSDKLGPGCFK